MKRSARWLCLLLLPFAIRAYQTDGPAPDSRTSRSFRRSPEHDGSSAHTIASGRARTAAILRPPIPPITMSRKPTRIPNLPDPLC